MPELAKANRMIVMSRDGFMSDIPISDAQPRARAGRREGGRAAVVVDGAVQGREDADASRSSPPTRISCSTCGSSSSSIPNSSPSGRPPATAASSTAATPSGGGGRSASTFRIKGNNYSVDLDLVLCGIYDGPEFINDLYFHYDYLNELLRAKNDPKRDRTSILFVRADSAEAVERLVAQIDQRYENSDHPTLSQSHQAFAEQFAKFAGNLQVYVRNIGLAVVFALTLVSGNAMAMSMRERTTEIAVLKAIGFPRGLVLVMVLGESVLISFVGGSLGVLTGRGVWSAAHHFWPQVRAAGLDGADAFSCKASRCPPRSASSAASGRPCAARGCRSSPDCERSCES